MTDSEAIKDIKENILPSARGSVTNGKSHNQKP